MDICTKKHYELLAEFVAHSPRPFKMLDQMCAALSTQSNFKKETFTRRIRKILGTV